MRTLLEKEIRLILPAWIAATALPFAVLWIAAWQASPHSLTQFPDVAAVSLSFGIAAGAILLGVAPFAQEFSCGTFTLFLAQPVSRAHLWRIKAGASFVGLMASLLLACIAYAFRFGQLPSPDVFNIVAMTGFVVVAFYTGGFWTSLLFRQTAAAFWFTLLIPLSCIVLVFHFLHRQPDELLLSVTGAVLLVYSAAGWLWARRQFLNAQDVAWTGGTISLPALRAVAVDSTRRKRTPLRALLERELQSQQVNLVIAGALVVLHLGVLFMRRMVGDFLESNSLLLVLLEFWCLIWLALPLLIGASTVAEERNAGVLESQLCLPTTRRLQIIVKLVVALLLGVALGAVTPWLIEKFGAAIGTRSTIFASADAIVLPAFCLVAAAITFISFFASTLTRNTLQALGAAMAIGFALLSLAGWARWFESDYGSNYDPISILPLIGWAGLSALLTTLLWRIFRNYNHLQVGLNLWIKNALTMAISLSLSVIITAFAYHRSWELPLNLEPAHGPARLSGPLRPNIFSPTGARIVVLLPDGRLWTASEYEWRLAYQYWHRDAGDKAALKAYRSAVPRGGVILGSNWKQVDSSAFYWKLAGIQSDGSLWEISCSNRDLSALPELKRIGSEVDWNKVAASNGSFLAVKQDGTLWGWGANSSGELGNLPKGVTDPVQIGLDSDWAAVFASYGACIGVKTDGSVWKWGGGRSKYELSQMDGHGLDWIAYSWYSGAELAVREDGTLWAWGNIPFRLLGGFYGPRTTKPIRIGADSDWVDAVLRDNDFTAIKGGEVIYQNNVHGRASSWKRDLWKPSKHSDWIAVAPYQWNSFMALAADGTLCLWGHPARPPAGFAGLLAPSRKPIWSVNILEEVNGPELDGQARAAR